MLRRFLRPRWQHPDPEVRIQALERLDPADPQQNRILLCLAREDGDEGVRRRAIARLQDPSLLAELAAEPRLGGPAGDRLLQVLPETVDEALLARLGEPLLARLLTDAPPPWQAAAAERLHDPDTCLRLLAATPDGALRRRLAAALPDRLETLERANRLIRNKDKGLARDLRQRIDELQRQARLPAEAAEQRRRLLTTLRGLRHLGTAGAVAHELERLHGAWSALPLPPDGETAAAWEQARAAVQAHLHELQQREEAARRLEHAHQVRSELCASLEALAADLEARPSMSADDLRQAERVLAIQRQSWSDRPPLEDESPYAQRYRVASETIEAALDRHRRRLEALPRLQELEARLCTLEGDETPDPVALRRLAEELDALPPLPEVQALAARRRALARRLAGGPAQGAGTGELRRALARLERALEAGRLHAARRAHQDLQTRLAIQAHLPRHLQRRLDRAEARLRELADWQQWAATPQKARLVEEAEALAEADLPPQALRDQLRELRRQWNRLGPAEDEAEAALQTRFEAACERAYQPVQAWHRQRQAQWQRNREAREAFLARLEGFLEQVDWSRVDWRRLAELERDVHREWRELGPTDRATREALGPRFRAVTRALHERLAAEWQRNQERREALIEEARALLEEEDPEAALRAWRGLQRRWRETGPVSPRQIKPLGRAFHQAGEAIVERWRSARRETAQQRREAIQARNAILEEMEALARQLARGEAEPAAIARLEAAWEAAPQVDGEDWERLARRHQRAHKRLHTARSARRRREARAKLLDRLHSDLALRQEDRPGTAAPAAQALERAETLLLDLELSLGLPSPPELEQARLARQVERLTRRLTGEEAGDRTEALLEAWLELPPLPLGAWARLEPRWQAILGRLEAAEPQGDDAGDGTPPSRHRGEAAPAEQ